MTLFCIFSDGFLNIEEFDGICKGLFRNDRGIVYSLDVQTLEHIFNIFDAKKVERIKIITNWIQGARYTYCLNPTF